MLKPLQRRLAKTAARLRRSYIKKRHIAALFDSVPHDALILEIGGGYNPRYTKGQHPNVYHLDHARTEELRAKYGADPTVAHLIDRIQNIDFVFDGRPIDTLVPDSLRFDVIYGSHVLEHQVDLIGHLQSIEKLLAPGGRVIHVVPDLRTCFDALRYPTVTADALLVHRRGAPTHRGRQVFETLSRSIDRNLGYRMSEADFEDLEPLGSLPRALQAMTAAEEPGQAYRDMHAWTFTPESFRLLMIELRLLDLVRMVPTSVSPTYGNQFCAVLQPAEGSIESMPATQRQALERERLALARQLRFRG